MNVSFNTESFLNEEMSFERCYMIPYADILFSTRYIQMINAVCVILAPLFSTCRPYRDRQKPANRTQCPILMSDI